MTTIQNVACIEATINPSDRRISINKDILRGKKILSMYLFAGPTFTAMSSPFRDEPITSINDIAPLSLFLNLNDIQGNDFIKDYDFKNSYYDMGLYRYINLDINRVLDWDNCFLTIKSIEPVTITKLLIYVYYQTQNFSTFSDEINGSFTIKLPVTSTYQDIKLSDIVDYTLRGKKIKKIISTYAIYGYLDLKCKENNIENLPVDILRVHSPKEFYFDNIEIDFENSYFRNRGMIITGYDTNLTFIY